MNIDITNYIFPLTFWTCKSLSNPILFSLVLSQNIVIECIKPLYLLNTWEATPNTNGIWGKQNRWEEQYLLFIVIKSLNIHHFFFSGKAVNTPRAEVLNAEVECGSASPADRCGGYLLVGKLYLRHPLPQPQGRGNRPLPIVGWELWKVRNYHDN